MEREIYTMYEVADLLGIGLHAAYRAAKRGDIPTIRIGFRILVPKIALNRLLAGTAAPDTTRETLPAYATQAVGDVLT
jgi:excisionase family DNA binding protein